MAPQYPCVQCGSSSFEEGDGIWYCHNGHEQEGGQQIDDDTAEFGKGGKLIRQKVTREKQKTTKVYRGIKGLQLYLKAWQHILWRQCYALIQNHHLPDELWTLVRELWILRLSVLTSRLEETADDDPSQAAEVSTTSESGDATDAEEVVKPFKTSKHAKDNPILPDTISIVYLGIILLRHPTTLATLYDYVRQEAICYIRAIRYIPRDIRDRLAPEYHAALDTVTIPTRHDLQLAVYRTVEMYTAEFHMVIPPLNWMLISFEYVRRLALPPEVFSATKYLANILQYGFAYPRQRMRRNATTYPDAQIMALILVATKLLYPFDANMAGQSSQQNREVATIGLNWQAWLGEKRKFDANVEQTGLTSKGAIEVIDADILRMSEERLDEYMDWFQRTYTKESKTDNLYNDILNMFPLRDLEDTRKNSNGLENSQRRILERLRATQAEIMPQRMIPKIDEEHVASSVFRSGQRYHQYRSAEEMPEAVSQFHQEAADLACLDTDALLRACLRTERLLLLHQHEKRRAHQFESRAVSQSE